MGFVFQRGNMKLIKEFRKYVYVGIGVSLGWAAMNLVINGLYQLMR